MSQNGNQNIRYKNGKRIVVRHIGSAHTDEELAVLYREAEIACEQLSEQLTIFPIITLKNLLLSFFMTSRRCILKATNPMMI